MAPLLDHVSALHTTTGAGLPQHERRPRLCDGREGHGYFTHVTEHPPARRQRPSRPSPSSSTPDPDRHEILEAICHAAVEIIPGADHACISTLDADEQLNTQASSDDVASLMDRLESEAHEGPCRRQHRGGLRPARCRHHRRDEVATARRADPQPHSRARHGGLPADGRTRQSGGVQRLLRHPRRPDRTSPLTWVPCWPPSRRWRWPPPSGRPVRRTSGAVSRATARSARRSGCSWPPTR